MDEREEILRKLEKTEGKKKLSPYLSAIQYTGEELINRFIENLDRSGGTGKSVEKEGLFSSIRSLYQESDHVLNLSTDSGIESQHIDIKDLSLLDHIDLLIIDAKIGVSENGAVWITGEQIIERRFPFITKSLVILLPKNKIVTDLSQAYLQIDLSLSGFGLWIAGPSKTADIEQSLVIGAQGATRHHVFIIN